MIDLKQFFELYGKQGMSKSERLTAEKELTDFYAQRIEDARTDGETDGHSEGYDQGYDEGYDSGYDDGKEADDEAAA